MKIHIYDTTQLPNDARTLCGIHSKKLIKAYNSLTLEQRLQLKIKCKTCVKMYNTLCEPRHRLKL